ncbi:MAG: DMT family transporter [Saprospiraceae bacterium]|nr:DMT family transporter [Saprospiraceae bacterium]
MNGRESLIAYLRLHSAVFLFGFTAILGALIKITALEIVWWRVGITAVSLLLVVRGARSIRRLSRQEILLFLGIGAIVALHWLCFYGAIKYSNASVTLICMATASFFTAIVEPIFLRQSFQRLDLIFGLLVIPGMALIVQNLDTSMLAGVWVGLLSALLAAIFASLNKKYIDRAHTYTITFLEMTGAWIFLTLIAPLLLTYDILEVSWPSEMDWFYLIILALLCTTLAFILALQALQHLSAFASNLVINLEPVYGILLAILLLNEHQELSPKFYIGVVAILGVVIAHPIVVRRMRKRAGMQNHPVKEE